MNVTKKQTGSELLIELEGSIDSTTSNELNTILSQSIKGINSLILDFKKIDYVSSAGLRVLLATFKELVNRGGTMVIRGVNQNVMDIFTMTGFDNILTIEKQEVTHVHH